MEKKNEKPAEDLTSTDTHKVPTGQWEQKLLSNEKTAAPLPPPADPKPAEKTIPQGRNGFWFFLLLICFLVSGLCGVYLTMKPGVSCPKGKSLESDLSLPAVSAPKKGPGIAWIKVRGVIAEDDKQSPFTRPSGASAIAKRIRQAAEDKDVKGIVLDINSPGGTVASVQNIYSEILNAKKQGKKVLALFRDVAASGGFYIAMGADKIMAQPGTITGSVGVIMQTSNVQGLMEKIGVTVTPITSGKYKDMGSAFRPMTDAEKAILQDMVTDTYGQFLLAVKSGRPDVTPQNLTEYTDGRVFTGQRAYNLGFIDALGGEEQARELMGEMTGLKNPRIITQRPDSLREMLFSISSNLENKDMVKQLQTMATPSVSYLWIN